MAKEDWGVAGPFGTPVPASEEATMLRSEELNLFDSTTVAIASVGPAYTIAATMAPVFVIAGVGMASPAVLIVSFLPVLFIALSYFHLNRRNPNCGASYSWLSEVVHPNIGWINGWVQIWTSVLFCTTAPLLAGGYTLQFLHSAFNAVSNAAINDPATVAWVAGFWLVAVTLICIYGIRWTANAQWVMVAIEYAAVIVFSIGGIIKVALRHPAHSVPFSMGWLDPFHIHGVSALAQGLALGVFFFWGWDTAANLNEESKDASRVPGRAGLLSMWLLLVIFVLNFVAVQMLCGGTAIANQGTEVLFYFGQQFAGPWASYVMIFAVLSSTIATTQTTVLPSARITLSMARDGVFPQFFGRIHPKYQTPALGTIVLAGASLVGVLLSVLSSSAGNVLNNLVNNIGVLVAFYYGITGLACAWAFRRTFGQRWRATVSMIVMPLVGGLCLLWVCWLVIKSGGMTALPDDIVLLSSVPALYVTKYVTRGRTTFFAQRPVAYNSLED